MILKSDFTPEEVISLMNYLTSEQQRKVIEKCPTYEILTAAINVTLAKLSEVCTVSESILSDNFMLLVLGIAYRSYENRVDGSI